MPDPRSLFARRTVATDAPIAGSGLFTGRPATLTIRPAEAGHGLRFRRTDLRPADAVPALVSHLSPRPIHPAFASLPPRCTALGDDGARPLFGTVEHVLSALAGLGVTDALIDLDGPEAPIGDGSAAHFAAAILATGVRELAGHAGPIRLSRRIEVCDDRTGATLVGDPSDSIDYRYELAYAPGPTGRPPIEPQSAGWRGDADEFAREIAPARTFCVAAEAVAMRALGLFDRLSARDLLVIGDDGPIDNAYRGPAEPARHKLLDLIGDLALAGGPIVGRVVATRSGHSLTHAFVRAVLAAEAPTGPAGCDIS